MEKVSFHMYVIFSYHTWIAASKDWILTTLLFTKTKEEETHPLEYQHSCTISLESRYSSPPLCKKHTKVEIDKKIQACQTITSTEGSIFYSYRCSKQSVSHLLTCQKALLRRLASKYMVDTVIHYYYVLVKSLVWWAREWLHCMFQG